MKKFSLLLSAFIIAASVALAPGCGSDSSDDGYWKLGMRVVGLTNKKVTAKAYKQIPGNKRYESSGTINDGYFAGDSSGMTTITDISNLNTDYMIVGKAHMTASFEPGAQTTGIVPLYVIERVDVATGLKMTNIIEYSDAGNNLKLEQRTIKTENYEGLTNAYTYGLAGDIYLVMLKKVAAVWDAEQKDVEFLGKRAPKPGDFWVSPNGEILYHAVSYDEIRLDSNRSLTATKVELRRTSNVDDAEIADKCLVETTDQDTSQTIGAQNPADHNLFIPKLGLDKGCEGNFTHRKVGTEWWYKCAKVREEAIYYNIEITDFGYEWVQWANNVKSRRTSKLKTPDVPPDARPFVEYVETITEINFSASDLTENDLYEELAANKPYGADSGPVSNGSPTIPIH